MLYSYGQQATCHNSRGRSRMLHVLPFFLLLSSYACFFLLFLGLDQVAVTVVKRDFSIVVVLVAFFVGSLHTNNSSSKTRHDDTR